MKIQYASDLHLEFADNWRYLSEHPIKVVGDVLVLAGDIGYLGDDNYSKHPFWDWASENYREVVCCMGNHEFYKHFDITTLNDGYCLEIRHNVHSYYNAVASMENVDFVVSTLWAEIPISEAFNTEWSITDFRKILYYGRPLTYADFNDEHKRCLSFVKHAIEESTAKYKIVVTHHVPSFQMQCPAFADSGLSGAFAVELQDYIKQSDIDFWIFGHSHYNVDKVIGGTTCLSNQLGYVFHNEHETFDGGKCIEIE